METAINKTQDYIIDHVGSENLGQVVNLFSGVDDILAELNEMFPGESNDELAEMIMSQM